MNRTASKERVIEQNPISLSKQNRPTGNKPCNGAVSPAESSASPIGLLFNNLNFLARLACLSPSWVTGNSGSGIQRQVAPGRVWGCAVPSGAEGRGFPSS